jgi:hypothetical protein
MRGKISNARAPVWWISDIRRFQAHYPGWSMRYDIDGILHEIFDAVSDRALQSQGV